MVDSAAETAAPEGRIANEPTNSKSYDAWSYGMALPMFPGSTGFSASGWITVSGTNLDSHAIPSRGPNRREWEASIMAAKGVVESVAEGSTVALRLHNKTLVAAFNNCFQNSDGEATAGRDLWEPLEALRIAKRIALNITTAEPNDGMMTDLKEYVRDCANRQLEKKGEDAALRGALAPRIKAGRGGAFPPIEGYVEKPKAIRRKRPRDAK